MTGQEIFDCLNGNQGVLAAISIIVAVLLAFLFKDKTKKVFNYIKGSKVSIWGLLNITKVTNVNNDPEVVLKAVQKAIEKKDSDDPSLKKFVYARYGKNYEELDKYSRAVLWENLEKYLKEVEKSE